jgi:hypothetical protein
MLSLRVNGPFPCNHPGTSESGWAYVDITGGNIREHNGAVNKWISKGFTVWINGNLEGSQTLSAYLIRKI